MHVGRYRGINHVSFLHSYFVAMSRYQNMNGRAGPKIGCMNCNGLGDKTKRNKVLTWLKGKPENIIFLQETHSTVELEDEWIMNLLKIYI